jgi:hypothetical protein
MRYLGLLLLLFTLASNPAEAKKKKRPHHAKRAKMVQLERRHTVLPRMPPQAVEPRPEAAAPAPVLSSVQADDDEVPGSRKKK